MTKHKNFFFRYRKKVFRKKNFFEKLRNNFLSNYCDLAQLLFNSESFSVFIM